MDDADLEKLVVKPGKLVPKFNRDLTQYDVLLNSGVKELKIDPLTRDSNASWVVVGQGTTRSIPIIEGLSFEFCIEVTAEDGSTKQYTISVTSLSSNSAVLSSITVKDYTLTPSPSMHVLNYECQVPCHCSMLIVSATSPDKKTNIEVMDSEEGGNVLLKFGATQIKISVTSPDGQKTVTYSIHVQRDKFMLPVTIPVELRCLICLAPVHCPVSFKGDTVQRYFCESCVQLVTRLNKHHPLTGELLPDDFVMKEEDIETRISDTSVKCMLGCGEEMKMRLLAGHMVRSCQSTLTHVEKVDQVLLGEKSDLELYANTAPCASCSHPVAKNEMQFHTDKICSSKQQYNFTHKIAPKKWEAVYQQEFLPGTDVDLFGEGIREESEYLRVIQSGQQSYIDANALKCLERACQYYCHGISEKPNDHRIHYRLGVVIEEMHYFKDIFGTGAKERKTVVVEEGDEFQTEESMLDDIRAVAEQYGFGSNASTTDQLKALDQEYHFLLEQGQSERADYVQKLYAFKQKQQHRSGNVNVHHNEDTPLGKAYVKFLDAASIEPNRPHYQLHVGRCLLRMKKYEEAEKRLKYTLALKPVYPEARFYYGLALAKQSKSKELSLDLLQSGLNKYLYELNWEHRLERKCICETFGSIFNTTVLDGIYELSKLTATLKDTPLYVQSEQLYHFLSKICFYAMFKSTKRKDTYKELISLALECQYDIGKGMMRGSAPQHNNEKGGLLRKYWDRLSNFTGNMCRFGNKDALIVQKKICEAAVILTPRSSKALCHFAEVLYILSEHSPDLVCMPDVEKCFRSCLALEGKNIFDEAEELPPHLLDSHFWKQHLKEKQKDASVASNRRGSVAAKTAAKTTPGSKSAAKAPVRNAPAPSIKTTGAKKTGLSPAGPSKAPAKPAVGRGASSSRSPAKLATTLPPKTTPGVRSPAKTVGKTGATPVRTSSHEKSHANSNEKLHSHGSKGSVKTCAKEKAPPQKEKEPPKEAEPAPEKQQVKKENVELNPVQYQPRLGLARVLVAADKPKNDEEIKTLYKEVIKMAPQVHSAYIELGEMLAKKEPMEAVDVYAMFTSTEGSYDDAYIYGEIVRLLMKEKAYEDLRLHQYMISLGQVMGFSSLERYVSILEKDFKNNKLLREVYAGINRKPVDDPDLQAFFKIKFWK